jgi:FKBP-type peptidyl-prolyl cis-trans isomerase
MMIVRSSLAIAVVLMAAGVDAQTQPRRPVRTAQQPGGAAAPAGDANAIKQKASYSFGMMIGTNLKKQGVEVDVNLFVEGLRDATSGAKLKLTEQEAGEAIAAFEKLVAEQKARESKEFLAQNKSRPGVQATASGLQYKVLKAGKGPKPAKNDAVSVIYRGMLINGDEFDSSGGKPFTIGVADVIPGWQEALQLMPVGSKWMIFIPAELAYGENGMAPIGPNATLVFDVELVDIVKAPPAGASKPRPGAEPIR